MHDAARPILLVLLGVMTACGTGSGVGGAVGIASSPADGSPPDEGSPGVDAGASADGGATFEGGSSAPDAASLPSVTGCTPGSKSWSLVNGNVRVDYDLTAGTATFFDGGAPRVTDFYAGVGLATYVTSKDYATRTCSSSGDQVVVTSTGSGLPTMRQIFLSRGGNHFLTQVVVEGSNLSSDWMGPVVMSTTGGLDPGGASDPRLLWIPYDNDAWARYNAASIDSTGVSFEAAAFYDNVSRAGVVVGSVTHDTWKTGVYYRGANGKLDALNVFGGATDPTWTHDVVPHGKVSGDPIASPVAFVGSGPDWRDLLEEYAQANLAYDAPLAWSGGVPFGWNSWEGLGTKVSYAAASAVSQFMHDDLQPAGFASGGTVYVNLDSYWTNLTDAELASFVTQVHGNGQKAGIYLAPFADWAEVATRAVENSTYQYGELWLRDAQNDPIALDGAYALDPTHPGTQAHVDYDIDKFKALGVDYVKLDFLNMGALESAVRFDPAVQTGIQAYNRGMQHILDRIAGTMFVSASIAPLFPYKYAHARRVSCDTRGAAVGKILSSEYELNSAAYGWWESGSIYALNDPDAMLFAGFPANDNMTRLLSAVVSGSVFLSGDDLSAATGQGLAKTYLTNPAIDAVARLGQAFRPVEGNTGSAAPDLFVLQTGGAAYLAVFNFTTASATRAIDLARAGLDGTRAYTVTDLWAGTSAVAKGTLSVEVDSHFGKLFALK